MDDDNTQVARPSLGSAARNAPFVNPINPQALPNVAVPPPGPQQILGPAQALLVPHTPLHMPLGAPQALPQPSPQHLVQTAAPPSFQPTQPPPQLGPQQLYGVQGFGQGVRANTGMSFSEG